MRTPTVLSASLTTILTLVTAVSAAGQTREPEPWTYVFVSEAYSKFGYWVNPGATGFGQPTRVSGYITFDRPEGDNWSVAQYTAGFQANVLAFGYRHDEFQDTIGFSQGDAYMLSLGYERGGNGIGVSRTWRTVGDAAGSWDIGWVSQTRSGFAAALVWRDLGSPVVRGVVRRERLIGGITFRPVPVRFSGSLQADYQKDGGKFRAFRVGGSFRLAQAFDVSALAQWNGDGDFDGFRIGLVYTGRKATVAGGAGLNKEGDIRTGSAGLAVDTPNY